MTITSPQSPGPTDVSPISVNINFDKNIDFNLGPGQFSVINGSLANLQRLNPNYNLNSDKDLTNFRVNPSTFEIISNLSDIGGFLEEKIANAVVAIDVDSQNNIYYLTFGNGVFKISNGTTTRIINPNEFKSPLDLVVSSANQILVADKDAYAIKVYSSTGGFQYKIGEGRGKDGNEFYGPTGLAITEDDILIVADAYTGDDPAGIDQLKRYKINGNNFNFIDRYGDQFLDDPYRVAVSSGNDVVVSDSGGSTGVGRVMIFSSFKNYDRTIEGGNQGSPGDLIFDKYGYLYVIDYEQDLTFSGIFQDPIQLANNFNKIKNSSYPINVYDKNYNYRTSFNGDLNLPIDLAVNNCGNILVDNLKLSGTVNIGSLKLDATFDFNLKEFIRSDSFTADLIPDAQGLVELKLESYNFYQCGPQPTGEFSIEYKLSDTVAPEFDCPEAIEVDNDPGVCGAVVNFETPTATDDSGETPTITQTEGPASGSEFPVGSTTITFTATDGSNNSSTCSFEIIVTDNEDPVFVCPENITETVPEGESGKVITYELDFSDNCGSVNVERTAGRASGDRFTLGTTRNTFLVTDVNGNTTTCSFDVTITEESPDLEITNCPGPQTFEVDENCAYLIPNIADIIETNIPEAEISQNIEEGFEVHGNLTLTITATYEDQTVTCDVSLIADDTIDPTITCPGDQTETVNEGEGFQLPNYVLQAEYDDNCAIASLRQEPDVQTVIYETTDVTLYVVDEAGNESSCTFTVTLEEQNQEILRINCPQNYTVSADENCNYWVPDFSTIVSATIEGATIEQDVLADSSFDPNSDPYIRVTATYEDQSDYCDIYLLPEDQANPVARCILEYQVTLDEGETVEIDPENLDGGSSDNCSIASFSLSQTQFTSADEGLQNIQFIVTDSAGNTDECTVAIMVVVNSEGNQAPIANADRYETPMDQTLNVSAENGILANDSDPEGDELEIILASSTNNGSLTLNADGSFQYAPNNGFFGTDTFTYYVTDGELDSETVEVSINVLQGENQQPVVVADQYSTLVNTTLNIDAPGVLANDYDPEGVELLAFLMDGPSNGTLELQQDGSFTYTPDNGFVGEDRFSYYATDEAGEGVATVTITVVDNSQGSPVANPDSYETDFNTTLTISEQDGILANDSDPNGDELFAVLVDDVSNGQLDLNSNGSFTYTPENGFSGTDSFTYHATDGEFNSGTVTVTITVNPEANTGDFSCAEDVTIFLRDEATYTIDITALYSGNTDGLTIEASRLTFGCEDVGETELTLTYSGAQDGSCVIPVTVIDRTAPDLQLRDITIQIGIEGTAEISFEDIDAGSSDLCSDDVTYELSQTEFTCDDLGDNIVQVTATDNYGNTITETVIVTVEGETCGNLPPGTEYTFIYPNPNSGSFTVATPSDISIKRIEVFDHRGRFIAAKDFKGDRMEYSMDVGPLQEAAYVLKIKTNKKDLVKRIIIKN